MNNDPIRELRKSVNKCIYLITTHADSCTENSVSIEDTYILELEKRLNEVSQNLNFTATEISATFENIEEIENKVKKILKPNKTNAKLKNKYFDKLSGFVTKRNQLLWENNKIDEFFCSLMK